MKTTHRVMYENLRIAEYRQWCMAFDILSPVYRKVRAESSSDASACRHILSQSFDWSTSPQGWIYWDNVDSWVYHTDKEERACKP